MKIAWFVDADGTLWHTNPAELALHDVAKELSKCSPLSVSELYTQLIHEQTRRLLERRFLEAFDWENIVVTVSKKYCDSISEKDIINVFRAGVEKNKHAKLLDGVIEVLRYAKECNIPVVVVSNGLKQYIVPVIEATGLDKYVDHIVTPDTVKSPRPIKPFKAIFSRAKKLAKADTYVMIGNNILFDCVGAIRAGLNRAYIIRNPSRPLVASVMLLLADALGKTVKTVMSKLTMNLAPFVHLLRTDCFLVSSWKEILRKESMHIVKVSQAPPYTTSLTRY